MQDCQEAIEDMLPSCIFTSRDNGSKSEYPQSLGQSLKILLKSVILVPM